MYESVVRIYATTQRPDYEVPWQSSAPSSGTGSGVVIAPGRILTGAHVVADATFLQVQKVSDPNKMVARVVAVSHDCDLALLEVDDPRMMDGVEPATVGQLPQLRDRVSVVGYPIGGEEISITEGVVSRVEVQRYAHSERSVLAVTVDAAINDGNSGGPVLFEGSVAGIAFQSIQDAENIGEMVPSVLIERFLSGVKSGREVGLAGLGVTAQNLENPRLRKWAGLGEEHSGVLLTSLQHGGTAWDTLQVGDALLAIAGYSIANNGTVQYRGRYRTSFDVVLGDHYVGDRLPVSVLRAGKVLELELDLKPFVSLVPRSQYETVPSYFVYGGMVFQPLSLDFLRTWSDWWEKAPCEFLHQHYSGIRTAEQQQVVVLTHVLADEINVGYERLFNASIASVNGVKPRDLRHFVEVVDAATDVIELRTSDDSCAVFEVAAMREANARIMDRYHIRADRSGEL